MSRVSDAVASLNWAWQRHSPGDTVIVCHLALLNMQSVAAETVHLFDTKGASAAEDYLSGQLCPPGRDPRCIYGDVRGVIRQLECLHREEIAWAEREAIRE